MPVEYLVVPNYPVERHWFLKSFCLSKVMRQNAWKLILSHTMSRLLVFIMLRAASYVESCHAIPCRTVPHHAAPSRTVPHRTASCRTTSYRAVPFRTKLLLVGSARHGTARHGTARHGTARHGRIKPKLNSTLCSVLGDKLKLNGTTQSKVKKLVYTTTPCRTSQKSLSTARHGMARHGTARHGTARHGTARCIKQL